MTFRTWARGLAPLLALGLMASACGSSGGGDDTNAGSDGTVLDQNAKDAAASALENTTTTATGAAAAPAEIKSIQDYEALWETQRAAVVKNIKDNKWGWDKAGNKVTGPGGFSVDLSTCPAGWDPYEGLVDGKIKLGQNMVFSGALADYGNIGVAQKVYFDYVNSQGGIDRRRRKDVADHDRPEGRQLRPGQDRADRRRAARLARSRSPSRPSGRRPR